jgi:hypothetical protein
MFAAPVVEDFGGWYLRGDIGISNQKVSSLSNALEATRRAPECRASATASTRRRHLRSRRGLSSSTTGSVRT